MVGNNDYALFPDVAAHNSHSCPLAYGGIDFVCHVYKSNEASAVSLPAWVGTNLKQAPYPFI